MLTGLLQIYAALMIFMCGGVIGGKGDFLDVVPTGKYWETVKVSPTVAQLEADVQEEQTPGDASKAVADLGSDDFKVRNKAKKTLEQMGPGVLPQLKTALASKDSEVAAAAQELAAEFSGRSHARSLRRLMAIRTLGEMKEKSAVDTLKGMEGSKELFVAAYARRAEAAIAGNAYQEPDHAAVMAEDVAKLPKNVGLVGQVHGLRDTVTTVDAMADQAIAEIKNNPMFVQAVGNLDRDKILGKFMEKVLGILEKTGNLRIDGATVGVSEDAGAGHTWGVVIMRGEFDREAVADAVVKIVAEVNEKEGGVGAAGVEAVRKGDLVELKFGQACDVLMPSNDEAVLLFASQPEDMDTVRTAMLDSIKTGKGGIADNDSMQTLLKGMDKGGPIWMAMKVSKTMKMTKTMEPFDTVTVTTKMGPETIEYAYVATGTDVEKVKTATETFDTQRKASIQQMKNFAAQMKQMGPLVKMMEDMKVEQADAKETISGSAPKNFMEAYTGSSMSGMIIMMQQEERFANMRHQAAGTMPAN